MKFTDIFIRRPVLAMAISVMILMLGAQALFDMQVRQYPKLVNTVVTVTTPYFGASAELIQGFVTQPLQQAMSEVENIDFVQSQSMQGQSIITAQMKLDSDPDAALSAVLAKVNSVRATLPSDIQDPVISRSTGSTISIVYLAFSSDELNSSQITDYLYRVIQPQLVTIPGVATARLIGGAPFAIRVWLDPKRMAALNLSAAEVMAALRANNYQSAPGQIKSDYFVYSVNAHTSLTSIDEFSSMTVATRGNTIVRLRDIAKVEMGSGRIALSATADGREAVIIGIDQTPRANPLTIAKNVRDKLPELQRNLPETINMKLLYDSTLTIQESIYEVLKTIAEAIAIVIVVIFLFMGSLRAVLIPVVTIPVSLVGVALVMQTMGFSINLMTLLAMVLAIGLVVDDAIVVVENVDRHLKLGEPPFRAAIIATREIATPIITMTLTLVAVYAPIAFLSGLTGALFKEFAMTLAGAVVVSGIVALTLSPMMSAYLLRHSGKDDSFESKVHANLDRLDDYYEGKLKAVLAKRPVFIVFALIVLISLPFLFKIIPAELAPAEDEGYVMVMATAPDNANLDYIEKHMAAISKITQQIPEVDTALTIGGVPASNQGLAIAPLVPWSQREASVKDVLQKMTPPIMAMPGVQASPFSMPPLPGASSGLPVQFVMTTPGDYKTLYSVAQTVQQAAQASGMFMFSMLDLSFRAADIDVQINRDQAAAYGVTMEDIGSTLALLLGDGYVNRVNIDSRSYEVIPQVVRADRLTPEMLGDYYVRSKSGVAIPLSNLIETSITGKPRSLTQFNQVNSAILAGVLKPGTSIGDVVDFLRAEAERSLPKGFSYDFLGETRQYIQEGAALYATFVLALIIIYLVLAAQFESLRDPLVILVSVPMAICGALLMLGFGLATMNIYTQIGLITLVGLITKHGILMCEVAKEQQLNQGLDRTSAIINAARIRLRPILMTTAAMVSGLVPLLLAQGAGAQSRFGIGLVIVSGLAIGTLFTLFVLPVVYSFIASQHKPLAVFEESRDEV